VDLIVLAGSSGRTLAFAPGDLLKLESGKGLKHLYKVVAIDIVDSRKGSLLLDTDLAMLSLVTCYPFDAGESGGPLRYVVTAKMLY